MRQMLQIPLCALILGLNARINPEQSDGLKSLGESCLKRLIHPIICRTDKSVLDGSRRVAAMRLVLGEKSDRLVDCIVTDENLSPADIIEISLTTALHRADLSGHEKWQACLRILEHHRDWSQKDLANHLDLDPGMITRILSPSKCQAAVQEALKVGKISLSDCYAMSRVGEQQQQELLTAKLNGASAAEVTHRIRKAQNGTPTAKVSRLRCPLPSGAVVQVALPGKGGIEDAICAVQEWIKEARRALEQGLCAKTFERACQDKARKS